MLAFNPFKIIVPLVPPQVVGLVELEDEIAGVVFTTTGVHDCDEGQLATVTIKQ